jgi:hypothetical protein
MAKAALRRMGILALGLAVSLPVGAVTAHALNLVVEKETSGATVPIHGVDLELAGHVDIDQALRFVDNGDNSDVAHVGNGAFPDEVTLRGMTTSGYGNGGMAWGFNLGMGVDANGSESLDVEQNNTSTNIYTRQADAWWYGPSFGTLATGWGPGVARFAGRSDLSGTDHAQNNDNRRAESVVFRDGVGSTNVTVGDLFRDYQGERSNRLAWLSPDFGGLQGGVSLGNDNESEVLLQFLNFSPEQEKEAEEDLYASTSRNGSPKLEAAAAYARNIGQAGTDQDSKYRFTTSGSVLFGNGLNLTAAYGRQDSNLAGVGNNYAWYTKAGWRAGNHAFSADYGWSGGVEDPVFTGNKVEGTRYGLGYQWATNPYLLYIGAEQYEMNRKASGAPDPSKIRTVMGGISVHF